MIRRSYQEFVNMAKQADVAWKQTKDLESLSACAHAWMDAGNIAWPSDKSHIECLQEAKDKFELLLDRDPNDHSARYNMGKTCFKLLREKSIPEYSEDYMNLCWQAIDCFVKAKTEEDSERMLKCMATYLPPDPPIKSYLQMPKWDWRNADSFPLNCMQDVKDAEHESDKDPENPEILMRWGTALMGLSKCVSDEDQKRVCIEGAMKKFDSVYSKTNDKDARYEYLRGYLEITPEDDVHYDQFLEEYRGLEKARRWSTSLERVMAEYEKRKQKGQRNE